MLGAAVTWNISNVGAVAGVMSDSYGVSLAAVGLLTTALFVTHAAIQIPAGRLCDRYGARVVGIDRKSTRLNSSHGTTSRMPSSA